MNWIKIECPYCKARIPLSSVNCPECRAIVPHECGDRERQKALRGVLAVIGIAFLALTAGLFYMIYQLLY